MTASRLHRGRSGFTLLELVLAIGLLALLVGMIFAVASQNLALGRTVVQKQNEESMETALFELLDTQFSALPGNARMELLVEDAGSDLLTNVSSELTIQNVPLSFTWGGGERIAKSVQLATVRRRDGLYDIVLRYFEDEILEDTSAVGDDSQINLEPFAEVVLMEDVYVFAWQVLDGRTMEWLFDWELAGRLPLQMELTFMRDQFADPIRHVFWITPKQNPELLMRQLGQGGGVAGGNGGDDGDQEPGEGEGGQGGPPGQGGGPGGNRQGGGGPGGQGGPGGPGGQGGQRGGGGR